MSIDVPPLYLGSRYHPVLFGALFFFEYFHYFPKHGNPAAGFAALKDAQDITSKVWAGAAALLTVFYFITFPDKP